MSDTVTYPSPTDIHFSRWLAAPPTLVWRAHTEQGQLERWWGPPTYPATVAALVVPYLYSELRSKNHEH